MSERFANVFSLASNLYTRGCPIIVEAGALLKDTETGNMIAQLKMKNIGEKVIISCKLAIKAYENNGAEVEGIKEFSYLDLNASIGDEFGSKTPIFLPVDITRSFSVIINEIVFEDKTSINFDSFELKPLPMQEKLSYPVAGLVDQYKRETTNNAQFKPIEYEDLWICTCGGINNDSTKACVNCKCTKEEVFKSLDEKYLCIRKEEYDNALAEEQRRREKEEAEHKERVRQKIKKTAKVIIIVAIAIAVIIAGSFIYKYISTNNKYNDAIKIGNSGQYEQAIKQLESIDPFKDSTKYINTFKADIFIEKADKLIAYGDYGSVTNAASSIDSSIIPSKEKNTLDMICNYAEALSLLDVESPMSLSFDDAADKTTVAKALKLLEEAGGYGVSKQIYEIVSDNEKFIGEWKGTAVVDRETFHKYEFTDSVNNDSVSSTQSLKIIPCYTASGRIWLNDSNDDGYDDDTGEMLPLHDYDCDAVGTTTLGIKRNDDGQNMPYKIVIGVKVSFSPDLDYYCDTYEGMISSTDVKDFTINGIDDFEESDYASLKMDGETIEGKTKNNATIKLNKQ